MTNLFTLKWITVAWDWGYFRQCCEYFMYFNWFLYLFIRPAILTAAKTKIIFILVRNMNMHGDLYNRVLFTQRYQTQESNEHQPVPSSLVNNPGYQQCQQFHLLNVYTSHDETPSRTVSRVPQVVSQRMSINSGKGPKSWSLSLHVKRPPRKSA